MEKQTNTNTNFRRFCVTTVGRMEERGNAPVARDLRQGKEGSLWAKTFWEWRRGFLGKLPFLFAVFAPFAVRIYSGHSIWISWTANNANGTNKEKQTIGTFAVFPCFAVTGRDRKRSVPSKPTSQEQIKRKQKIIALKNILKIFLSINEFNNY